MEKILVTSIFFHNFLKTLYPDGCCSERMKKLFEICVALLCKIGLDIYLHNHSIMRMCKFRLIEHFFSVKPVLAK